MSFRRWLIAVVLSATLVQLVAAAQPVATLSGRSVQSVLDELRAAGAPLVYSSNLLPATLTVATEPAAAQPLEIAREILAPHGLAILSVEALSPAVRLGLAVHLESFGVIAR